MLLMFAPLRDVMAMQSTHCQMDDMMENMEVSSQHAVMAGMHDMSAMSLADSKHHNSHSPENQPIANSHQCCCCDDGANCAGNCDMGMSVSLVMHISSYAPAFIDVTNSILFSSDPLIRELTPPSRPPQHLYS